MVTRRALVGFAGGIAVLGCREGQVASARREPVRGTVATPAPGGEPVPTRSHPRTRAALPVIGLGPGAAERALLGETRRARDVP